MRSVKRRGGGSTAAARFKAVEAWFKDIGEGGAARLDRKQHGGGCYLREARGHANTREEAGRARTPTGAESGLGTS